MIDHTAARSGSDSSCSMAKLPQLIGCLQAATPRMGRKPVIRKIRILLIIFFNRHIRTDESLVQQHFEFFKRQINTISFYNHRTVIAFFK